MGPPHSRRTQIVINLIGLGLFVAAATWCSSPGGGPTDDERRVERASAIDRDLTAPAAEGAREGIAAVVLMDVSGSMADPVQDSGGVRPKIEIARRAALDLVRQFDRYAKAHPGEPVLVGLFEFSQQPGAPSSREVIPLSAPEPDRAAKALAQMRASGGTPIGQAMVAGKRALDGAGLTRRHLLVVTDGENTDGYEPSDVMAALARRPEAERPSVYFVAFDIEAWRFRAARDAGALVLAAASAQELNDTLDSLLTGKILVEGR